MTDTLTQPLIGTAHREGDTDEAFAQRQHAEAERRERVRAGFRDLDELVERAGVIYPDATAYAWSREVHAEWNATDVETFRALVRALGSTIDSPWEKSSTMGRFQSTRRVSDGLILVVVAAWGACEKVEVGTRVETVEKVVEPARTLAVEETVPVYEWRCPESIFDQIGDPEA